MAIRMAMIPMTTRISMSVKAGRRVGGSTIGDLLPVGMITTLGQGRTPCRLPRARRIAYDSSMSTVELRRKIKKQIDRLPPKRLESLADYVAYLARAPLAQRLAAAEKAIASGKGVNWRKVRSD